MHTTIDVNFSSLVVTSHTSCYTGICYPQNNDRVAQSVRQSVSQLF